jgi:dihydroneopterin aldolase
MAIHGVLESEQITPQPFSIDIDLFLVRTDKSDTLESTVDYATVIESAVHVMTEHSYQLLESIAAAIADHSFECDERIGGVRCTVRKLEPPVPYEVASVGATVFKRRPGLGGDEGAPSS